MGREANQIPVRVLHQELMHAGFDLPVRYHFFSGSMKSGHPALASAAMIGSIAGTLT
jgi:hypothetical protein